ncbi:MAG: hypothetical protein AAFQ74_08155, partial [Cyanobacteria bacterium J06623_4]
MPTPKKKSTTTQSTSKTAAKTKSTGTKTSRASAAKTTQAAASTKSGTKAKKKSGTAQKNGTKSATKAKKKSAPKVPPRKLTASELNGKGPQDTGPQDTIDLSDTKNLIRIRGARQHNLKDVSLDLPRDKMIVFTGVSGSGKSSLAFDTIFAEGQRRYVESLSAYARQFLGQVDKPDVDAIEGLSPAISIDQKSTSHNPRSTVGTVTEIYDYLRLLYGRAGQPHCPQCDRSISPQSIDQMVDKVMELPNRTRFQLLAPVVRGKKGTHQKLLSGLAAEGFVRVRVNGELRELSDNIELDKNKKHDIE